MNHFNDTFPSFLGLEKFYCNTMGRKWKTKPSNISDEIKSNRFGAVLILTAKFDFVLDIVF